MYTRLKQEFEADPLFKSRLENNGESVDFIHALEALNSYVNGGKPNVFLLEYTNLIRRVFIRHFIWLRGNR